MSVVKETTNVAKEGAKVLKKVNKAKLVVAVLLIGFGIYILMLNQRNLAQRSLYNVMHGYVSNAPPGMTVDTVKVVHSAFPPKYEVDVDYKTLP